MPSSKETNRPQDGKDYPATLLLSWATGPSDRRTLESKFITPPILPDKHPIGRQHSRKTTSTSTNGYFTSKAVALQHAEVWADEKGRVWIQDLENSNGTFVNDQKLLPNSPLQLRVGDTLVLGVAMHERVSAKVIQAGTYIFNLPTELLINILEMVDGESLLQTRLVCRRLNGIILHHQQNWREAKLGARRHAAGGRRNNFMYYLTQINTVLHCCCAM